MEREIKFRAWDTTSKPQMIIWDKLQEFTCKYVFLNCREVTLMQYTGLKDKNGKEIYEGDILADAGRTGYDLKNFIGYEVFYHDNDHCEFHIGFQMNRHHFFGAFCGTEDFRNFKPITVSKMEVIGNIYENPELLTNPK